MTSRFATRCAAIVIGAQVVEPNRASVQQAVGRQNLIANLTSRARLHTLAMAKLAPATEQYFAAQDVRLAHGILRPYVV
jgi:hypothetical protein